MFANIFFFFWNLVPGECGTVGDCGDNALDCLDVNNYQECECIPRFWYNPYQKRCGKIQSLVWIPRVCQIFV